MVSRETPSDSSPPGATRRRLLTGAAGLLVGLAGCSSDAQSDPVDSQTDTGDASSPGTSADSPRTPTGSPGTSGSGSGTPTPESPDDTGRSGWAGGPWPTIHPGESIVVADGGEVVNYGWLNGNTVWKMDFDATDVAGAPVAGGKGWLVGGRDGTLATYDPTGDGDGWNREIEGGLFPPNVNDATPLASAGETYLVAHPRGVVYALDAEDGTTKWRREVPRRVHRPAVSSFAEGSVVLVADGRPDDSGSVVLSLSLSDGSERWRRTSDAPVEIAPRVFADTAYVADTGGTVTALSVVDGSEKWRVTVDGDPRLNTIPTWFGRKVWVGARGGGFYGVTEDGVQASLELGRPTTPAAEVTGDVLAVGVTDPRTGDAEGRIVGVAPDGTVRWDAETGGVPGPYTVAWSDRRFVGTVNDRLVVLDAEDGTAAWE